MLCSHDSQRDGERRRRNGSGGLPACPLLAATAFSLVVGLSASSSRAEVGGSALERCRAIVDQAARLRCFEEATSKPNSVPRAKPDAASAGTGTGAGTGTWRLVRTPNPGGGPDAVSIMQTAEPSRSDIDLAGLMLRCGDTGFDVLVVLLQPFPPRAHPKVKLTARGSTVELQATVLPPGAAIALPGEAAALVNGPWQTSPELALEVEEGASTIRGVVSLVGLGPAVALLKSNCPTR
jgi:hypothetical protein